MKLVNYNMNTRVLKVSLGYGLESINQLLVLVYIAQAGPQGRTVSEVEDHCDFSQSAASRNCRFLSASFNLERKGVDLVECFNDPTDKRVKVFRLNVRGLKAVAEMENLR